MNRDEWLSDKWLKSVGINPATFGGIDINQLKALKIAFQHFNENDRYLTPEQTTVLQGFVSAMSNKARRSKLTQGQCYEVMNIGKKVNRELFKAYRKLKR